MTEWRDIPGWEGLYQVSDEGAVRSARRICKGTPDHGGYLRVHLQDRATGRAEKRSIHALVLLAFVGPRPAGHDGDHIDGAKLNNRLSNLRYASRSENELNKIRNGAGNTGERCATSKLSGAQVDDIRRRARKGNYSALAREFGVSFSTTRDIALGRTWRSRPSQQNDEAHHPADNNHKADCTTSGDR
jgi:hypothetical protein